VTSLSRAAIPAPEHDLSVVVTDSLDPVAPASRLTYGITGREAGPAAAFAVFLEDSLPSEVTFVRATPSRGSCTHDGSAFGGEVTCDVGPMAPGDTVDLTLEVQVAPGATGPLLNAVRIENREDPQFGPIDIDPKNDHDDESTEVSRLDFAAVVLVDEAGGTLEPTGLRSGDAYSYVLRVVNLTDDDLVLRNLRFTLSPGVTVIATDCRRIADTPEGGSQFACPDRTVPGHRGIGARPVPHQVTSLGVRVAPNAPATVFADMSAQVALPGRPGLVDLTASEPTPVNRD
jgi:uncharacterized repeat protein (TIGR01451 family)